RGGPRPGLGGGGAARGRPGDGTVGARSERRAARTGRHDPARAPPAGHAGRPVAGRDRATAPGAGPRRVRLVDGPRRPAPAPAAGSADSRLPVTPVRLRGPRPGETMTGVTADRVRAAGFPLSGGLRSASREPSWPGVSARPPSWPVLSPAARTAVRRRGRR